jgi:Asp/Glu/hydantoin racemase
MKIWYQSYTAIGADPKWRYYEESLEKHLAKVARPDTKIDIHGVDQFPPKMLECSYFQYLHIRQVIENAIEAEEKGYDVFVLAGMRDFAYNELKDVVDIPLAFIAEACFHMACLLAPKFSVIWTGASSLKAGAANVKRYGLEDRYVPGINIAITHMDLLEAFEKDPQKIIGKVKDAVNALADQGAGIVIPGFGGLSSFLAEHGVNEIDGVPILDNQAALLKTAETLVDLRKLGISRSKRVPYHPSKTDLGVRQTVKRKRAGSRCAIRAASRPIEALHHRLQSTFTFASLITRAHLAISLFMKVVSSSGVLLIGSMPARVNSSFISGWDAARTISLCSLTVSSRGVPAGASTAYQTPAS